MNSNNQALSIIHALESTNDVPSPLDQACLTSHLSTLNRDIDALNNNIQTLIAQRARYSRVLSLLRHLPAELLLEIFHHLWLEQKSIAVHQLARVCSSWGSIVLNTALFWTHVVLSDDYYYDKGDSEDDEEDNVGHEGGSEGNEEDNVDHEVDSDGDEEDSEDDGPFLKKKDLSARLMHHIQRSRDLPMSMRLEDLFTKNVSFIFHHVFNTVKAHWSNISLHATKISQMKQMVTYYRNFPNEAEFLSNIEFTAQDVDGAELGESASSGNEDGVLDFTILSNLRSFRLDMRSFIDSRRLFKLDWANLIHLCLGSSSTSKEYILYVFHHCSNLESLNITTSDPTRLSVANLEPVTLKILKTLTIKATRGIPSVLLRKLWAPLIEELALDFHDKIPSGSESIMVFLKRLKRKLLTLRCTGHVMINLFYHQYEGAASFKPFSTITTWRITEPYLYEDDYPERPIDCKTLYYAFADKISLFSELKLVEFSGHNIDGSDEIYAVTELLSVFSELGEGQRMISKQYHGSSHPSQKLREYQERTLG